MPEDDLPGTVSERSALNKPVLCLGILVVDLVGKPLRSLPDLGRLVLVDEMGLYTGGCASNAAIAVARLGLPVDIMGKIGVDALGDFFLGELQKRGVGTRAVLRDPEVGTSGTMVLVDPGGERRFVHFIGANARFRLEDVNFELIARAGILHIGGALVLPGLDGEPMAEVLKRARQSGLITLLDVVWDDTGRWMQVLAPCLPYVDYFIPSLPEGQALTGLEDPDQVARALLEYGIGTVGLKMGADGCLVMTAQGEALRLPAYEVEVVDATGAGDAFAAGFIAGIWHGWPLEQTARFANAVGGLNVTGFGATGGVRPLPETLAFMERTALKKPPPSP